MNIHHLELFYYVAKFGGITEAVRKMPYGIQQPAVSAQLLQLEATLDLPLFHRRPFALTPAGQELYDFVSPFFGSVSQMEQKLRGGLSQQIRLGASEMVLRDHIPAVLQEVRKSFPRMKVSLRLGYQPELEAWLQSRELDMAVTLLNHRPAAGTRSEALLILPLILLVTRRSGIDSAEALFRRDRIDEPLISLPPNEGFCQRFQEGLLRLKVLWQPSIEVSSLDLVIAYVATGNGIGLGLDVPGMVLPRNVRKLRLEEFDSVALGALWRGRLNPAAQALLDCMRLRASRLVENGELR